MKSEKEIKAKLKEVEADEALHRPPANVFVNAPLALFQMELETRQRLLKWVLDIKKK